MSAAKTNAERQAALKARRLAAGLVMVTQLWVHPDDVQSVREFAAKLARRRKRADARFGIVEDKQRWAAIVGKQRKGK